LSAGSRATSTASARKRSEGIRFADQVSAAARTNSDGDSPGAIVSTASTSASPRSARSVRTTSSLVGKWRKKVDGATSARAQTSSTVTSANDRSAISSSAAFRSASRVASFLRARRPSSSTGVVVATGSEGTVVAMGCARH